MIEKYYFEGVNLISGCTPKIKIIIPEAVEILGPINADGRFP